MTGQETGGFEKKDSITVKRNAEGEYAWDIKIYLDNETQEAGDVLDQIERIDFSLREKFLLRYTTCIGDE